MEFFSPSVASASQFYLLADARSVDANAQAATTMIWRNGAGATNTIPIIARVFRKTGTLVLMVGTLRLNSTIIQPISAVSSALMGSGADPINFLLDTNTSTTVVPASGNWDLNVTTINGGASTVDVEVWGFKMS